MVQAIIHALFHPHPCKEYHFNKINYASTSTLNQASLFELFNLFELIGLIFSTNVRKQKLFALH